MLAKNSGPEQRGLEEATWERQEEEEELKEKDRKVGE